MHSPMGCGQGGSSSCVAYPVVVVPSGVCCRFDALEQAVFKGAEARAKMAEDARVLRQEVAAVRDHGTATDGAVAALRAAAQAYEPRLVEIEAEHRETARQVQEQDSRIVEVETQVRRCRASPAAAVLPPAVSASRLLHHAAAAVSACRAPPGLRCGILLVGGGACQHACDSHVSCVSCHR